MNIALLNRRVTFQKLSALSDIFGNHTNQFKDYFTCFATMSGTGNETEAAGRFIEQETADFTVRWCKALSTVTPENFRILSGEKIYNILYVDLMGGKHRALKFHCERTRS